MNKHIIAVGGENLIDFVEVGPMGGPVGGPVEGVPHYAANAGGGPFNIAVAAARQGGCVHYLTPISDDRLGQMLTARLAESGVCLTAPHTQAPTSLAMVSVADGEPAYQFYREGTADRAISTAMLMGQMAATRPWVFHIGSLALCGGADAEIWEEAFINCHKDGIITSLDPNIRPALITDRGAYIRRIENMASHADIIKLSDEDITWLYPERTPDDGFDHLGNIAGDTLMVLTMGADGAKGRSMNGAGAKASVGAGGTAAYPARPLVDTVGAGDTFMASMLTWLEEKGILSRQAITALDDAGIASMLGRAAMAAGLNCTRQGCNPPYAEEMRAEESRAEALKAEEMKAEEMRGHEGLKSP